MYAFQVICQLYAIQVIGSACRVVDEQTNG